MPNVNAAIKVLESRRDSLVLGLNSISEQRKRIAQASEGLSLQMEDLALSESSLAEINAALEVLRSGDSS